MESINKAIDVCGGASQLAAALNVKVQRLLNWRARGVPAERCPDIERVTNGAVTCEELRPDVDWAVLRKENRRKSQRRQKERRQGDVRNPQQ